MKNMKVSGLIIKILFTASLLAPLLHAHGFNVIRSGNWVIQVETLVAKIPMNIQPKHYSQCLGQNSPIPTIPDAGRSCSITKHEIKTGEVKWELNCQAQEGNRTGRGYVKYNGNTVQGQLEMTINHPSFRRPHQIQYRIQGRRTGPCQRP